MDNKQNLIFAKLVISLNPKFGKIDWSFSPLALFQAKLGWYIHIEQETHALVFDLSIDTSKQLQFSDITGTLSSATLKKFKLLPDNISNIASFEVKIDEFDIDWNANNLDARPDSLQGLVQVKKLNVLGELLLSLLSGLSVMLRLALIWASLSVTTPFNCSFSLSMRN
jgi:hypothetical protein